MHIRCLVAVVFYVLASSNLLCAEQGIRQTMPKLIGFKETQVQQLEELWRTINKLKTKKLIIPESLYTEHSRFEILFGFKLTGGQLTDWLKKRIQTIEYGNSWTVAVSQGQTVVIGNDFFNSSLLEQSYMLIHEARHSEASCPAHIRCPDRFPYLSAGQPDMILAGKAGCDATLHGAYSYQAAFLFELSAYGLLDGQMAAHYYNATISRILPVIRKVTETHFGGSLDTFRTADKVNLIEKLNQFSQFTFEPMWQTSDARAYHNVKIRSGIQARYTIILYSNQRLALDRYRELKTSSTGVALIGSILIIVPGADPYLIIEKIKFILIGAGYDLG